MAEYIEREATLKIVTDMMCDCKVTHKGRAIRRNIKQIPTADVVEVVRCKACEYYKPQQVSARWSPKTKHCTRMATLKVNENDFCSYGKRKEGAEE